MYVCMYVCTDVCIIVCIVNQQIFEAPENILRRDPTSLLSQLCEPDPSLRPILPDQEGGFFVFDRDW